MPTLVLKFGGSSLANARRLRGAAARVARTIAEGHRVAVVVSAMGRTTDRLIGLARDAHPEPPGRELDALLATGELVSASLLSMAIARLGLDAASLNAMQAGIATDSIAGRARIERIDATAIAAHLDAGRIPVIAGFQGIDPFGDFTTLGRGGSDTTAVAIAAAIGASGSSGWCEILTDVPGVCTADPRVIRDAERLPRIASHSMLELADRGAKVMHTPAVALAAAAGVRIRVAAAHRRGAGTLISPSSSGAESEPGPIAVAIRSSMTAVDLRSCIDQCDAGCVGGLARVCPSLMTLDPVDPAEHALGKRSPTLHLVSAADEATARLHLREASAIAGGEWLTRSGCALVSVIHGQAAATSPAALLRQGGFDASQILAAGGAGTTAPWVLVAGSQAVAAAGILHRPIRERMLARRRGRGRAGSPDVAVSGRSHAT